MKNLYDTSLPIFSRFRDELRMSVNRHTPMASSYGQPQPGYGQTGYTPLDGGYPTPYAPYNGPASAFQPGVPPQGKTNMSEKENHYVSCEFLKT